MKKPASPRPLYLLLAGLLAAAPASALDFQFGDGDNRISIDWDNSLTYGAQWRVQSADSRLLAGDGSIQGSIMAANRDDGNRNFHAGSLISNRVTLLSEMDIRWRDAGIFLRGKAFYDSVYQDGRPDHGWADFQLYNSGTFAGGSTGYGRFPAHTVDDYGSDIHLLDAFAYGSLDLGERRLNLRAGRQVINWGESTFYPGIMGLQNRVDIAASNTPGVAVKEILLPTGALYGQIDLSPQLTLEAYYQYEWKRTKLDGVGSYFSTVDQMGPGAEQYLIAFGGLLLPVPRSPDERPSQNGQWGVALRYLLDNGTELTFYNMVAHSKTPSFQLRGTPIGGGLILPTDYNMRYFDNIRLYGVSFSTVIGTTQVAGELSYRPNGPVASGDLTGSPVRAGLYMGMLNGTHIFGPSWLADDTTLVFEIVTGQHSGRSDKDLQFDSAAWGVAVRTELAWNNVLPGVDLKMPVFYSQGIEGTIREMNLVQHAKTVGIGLDLLYLQRLEAGIHYNRYFGGGIDNWIRDRDNIALTLKYSF